MWEKNRRNRYHLSLLRAINDLQVTPALLLTALKRWDTRPEEREEALKDIREAMDRFEPAWKRLQEVYAVTRFPAYPEDYVKDRYFHMASRSEDQS